MDNTTTSTGNAEQKVVRFRCSGCKTSLKAPTSYVGKQVKCAKCSQSLQVPALRKIQKVVEDLNSLVCICASCKHVFKKQLAESEQRCKCPECGYVFDVPEKAGLVSGDDILRFQCDSCRQNYCVLSKYAGKKFGCLNCRHATAIPIPALKEPEPESELQLVDPELLEDAGDDPAKSPDEYPLMEEVIEQDAMPPQEFDMSQLQPAAAAPGGKKKKKPRQSSSAMAKLKIPLIVVAGIAGFVIGFIAVSSLFKGSGQTETTVPVQAPAAIQVAEEIVTQLHQVKAEEVAGSFSEDMTIDLSAVRDLAYSVSLGDIDKIDSTVTFSRTEEGAAGYIVESVVTYAGQFTRTVRAGFVISEQMIITEEDALDFQEVHSLMGLCVLDSDGTELNAIGETADFLITKLNTFVDENSMVSVEALSNFICTFVAVILVISLITRISQIAVFARAGEPGWAVLIPIYREVCMSRMADKNEGMGWLCGASPFIPYVGLVIYMILIAIFCVGIARTFEKGVLFGLGLFFLPFIFYPILAFSGRAYD